MSDLDLGRIMADEVAGEVLDVDMDQIQRRFLAMSKAHLVAAIAHLELERRRLLSEMKRQQESLAAAAEREQAAKADGWDEGYGDGVHDEALAAEMPMGYWIAPCRVNPYRVALDGPEGERPQT